MKNYVCFENKGELPINALKLLGASTKETDDSKIGFWGSGLKYALAVLLRNKVEVVIYSGKKLVKVTTTKVKLGNDSFDVITINGSKTSITTRAGKDWELWFAIREIHSNQIDEGNDVFTISNEPVGNTGSTRIYIELTHEINDVMKNYDEYFAYKRNAIFSCSDGEIFNKTGSIYRKGIKANSEDINTMYDYDLFNASINESRVFNSYSEISYHGAEVLSQCTDELIISNICSDNDCYEQNYFMWGSFKLSDTWLRYLQTKTLVKKSISGYYSEQIDHSNSLILSDHFSDYLIDKYRNVLKFIHTQGSGYAIVVPTPTMKNNVDESMSRLSKAINFAGLEIVYALLDGDTCGMYEKGKVIIDVNTASIGGYVLDMTLLEEYAHHVSGADDFTRKFQTFIIKKWYDAII